MLADIKGPHLDFFGGPQQPFTRLWSQLLVLPYTSHVKGCVLIFFLIRKKPIRILSLIYVQLQHITTMFYKCQCQTKKHNLVLWSFACSTLFL